MKILLTMYSIRRMMEKDLYGALEQAKLLGFDGIELAWYAGHPVETVRKAVKDLELDVWACQTSMREMLADADRNFDDIASLGARYAVICFLTAQERPGSDGFERTCHEVQRLKQLAREKYGLTLLYHNHDFDFTRLPDGRYALDACYSGLDVGGELDTCWAELCGASTVELLHKYHRRIPLMHIKDFRKNPAVSGPSSPAPGFEFCPLGWGETDFSAILKAAEACGTQGLVLELDEPGCQKTELECVQLGLEHLKVLLGR